MLRTDREKQGLKGAVKNVFVEMARFEKQDDEIVEKPWFSHSSSFNRDGQQIEYVVRNPDGSEWRTVSDYSDSGNLLATRSFDAAGAFHSEMRYVYDANDRLTAEQRVTSEGSVTTLATYAYDDAGFKMKIQELDHPAGENVMIGIEGANTLVNTGEAKRVESRYDERGEVVEVKIFKIDGAVVCRVEIARDAEGNSLEETQFVGDSFPFGACESDSCSTEEIAALTEEQKAEAAAEFARIFSPGTAMSKNTHRYDAEGRLIESKLTMMGMEISRQTFAYDEFGNKSEEVSYNENGMLSTKALFEREYDEHGNWTTELVSGASSWDAEFGLSTPAHVTRRRITYW